MTAPPRWQAGCGSSSATVVEFLDRALAGEIRVVSMCAGQGRDLLEVLTQHPRAPDVAARLVELDPRNAEVAMGTVAAAGLKRVEIVTGDASITTAYEGMVPCDLVLVCGCSVMPPTVTSRA